MAVQDGKSTLDPKRVQTHVSFCAETLKTAVTIHEVAQREEDRNLAKREEQRQRLKVRLPPSTPLLTSQPRVTVFLRLSFLVVDATCGPG